MTSTTFQRIAKQAVFYDEGHGFDIFGLCPQDLARVVDVARPLYDHYFRVDSLGVDHIPASGPTILIANHSGMVPVDGAMLCIDVLRRANPPRIPRPVADHFVPRLPLVSTLFARFGVVSGTRPNVRRLLERGELIAIFPEGVSGPGKKFRERYQIQDWRVGFAELAIRYRAAIVPVAIIGAEESLPLLGKLPFRLFGSPYLPIPASPIPLPSRLYIRYGAPMLVGYDANDADNPALVAAAAHEVRDAVEMLLDETLASRPGVFR